jgi:hypothetical protein
VSPRRILRYAVLGSLAVAVIFIANFALALLLKGLIGSPGQFGDIFGFANALVSALALVAILITVAMQGEQLKLQRIEQAKTGEAHRETAEMQRRQIEALVSEYEALLRPILQIRTGMVDRDLALIIENVGRVSAHDCRFTLAGDLFVLPKGVVPVSADPIFCTEGHILSPGEPVTVVLYENLQACLDGEEELPSGIEELEARIHAEYDSGSELGGKEYQADFHLSLSRKLKAARHHALAPRTAASDPVQALASEIRQLRLLLQDQGAPDPPRHP